MHSLTDQVPFKLCERPKNIRQQLTDRCPGIDRLSYRSEPDTPAIPFRETLVHIDNRPKCTIKSHNSDRVDSASSPVGSESFPLRPVEIPTTGLVDVLRSFYVLQDRPIPQRHQLRFRILAFVSRRSPRVDSRFLWHGCRSTTNFHQASLIDFGKDPERRNGALIFHAGAARRCSFFEHSMTPSPKCVTNPREFCREFC